MPQKPKYKPEYCEMLLDHLSKGFSYDSFGGDIGICRATMYNWEEAHPEWKEAKIQGQKNGQKFFEQRLIAKISGQEIDGIDLKKIDVTCLIFALKTRYWKTYSEKTQIEHTGENVSITFTKNGS